MPFHFLDIPPEILVQILSKLDARSLRTCLCVCRALFALYTDSSDLNYLCELADAGLIDCPAAAVPAAEKRVRVRAREAAWREVRVSAASRIEVPFNPSGIYDLTGGHWFLGTCGTSRIARTTKSLYITQLPAAQGMNVGADPTWRNINVGEEIIDVGISAEEHDLVALVTWKGGPFLPSHGESRSIDIHLKSLSTGQNHPLARESVIHILNAPTRCGRVAIMLEVVGDTLAFLLQFPRVGLEDMVRDQLFLIDWQKGEMFMHRYASGGTYNSLVFLSHDTLCLPNNRRNALELFRIPPRASIKKPKYAPEIDSATWFSPLSYDSGPGLPPLDPVAKLALPPLKAGSLVMRAYARAEPNPVGPACAARHHAAVAGGVFAEDPAEAICLFNIAYQENIEPLHFANVGSMTFIVHRHALLDLLAQAERDKAARDASYPADGGADGEEDDDDPLPELTSVSDSSGFASGSSGDARPGRVPWADWGPARTRWFRADDFETRWITTSAGARHVRIAEQAGGAHAPGNPLIVMDFGRTRVGNVVKEADAARKAWAAAAEKEKEKAPPAPVPPPPAPMLVEEPDDDDSDWETDESDDDGAYEDGVHDDGFVGPDLDVFRRRIPSLPQRVRLNRLWNPSATEPGDQRVQDAPRTPGGRWLLDGESTLMSRFWSRPVNSSLPYILTSSDSTYNYTSVLMDEDRVIGLQTNDRDEIGALEVLHIG